MENTASYTSTRKRTFNLIITAMLIALVFVATLMLNIRLPFASNGGLVHLGTAMLFLASILFGPKKGAMAGAVGMALFDLVSGWTLWAPFTFIARGLQGYIVGRFAWANGRKGNSIVFNTIGIILGLPVMLAVYYVCEGILYGNWYAPLASIPGNLLQNAVGIVIALPVAAILKRIKFFEKM
ncbi:ECF transporter S component [Paenisporosarcina cavernae]|uniref:ECF transporter S component n=1 Tax=Paenisporosarcina cavernae TaxID=2320858 RepID=A0A385YR62_9BACL|nr:ECF transporter S component [Paenisporosarcina cavernae]AYC28487.1 ECF transporter S component [Paenisporosarcina cavernae]